MGTKGKIASCAADGVAYITFETDIEREDSGENGGDSETKTTPTTGGTRVVALAIGAQERIAGGTRG